MMLIAWMDSSHIVKQPMMTTKLLPLPTLAVFSILFGYGCCTPSDRPQDSGKSPGSGESTGKNQEGNAGQLGFDVELTTISSGYDRKTCWVHPRGGVVPPSTAVITMQKLLLTGTDVFYALNEMRTDDLGSTWKGPVRHETLARRHRSDGFILCPCDFWP